MADIVNRWRDGLEAAVRRAGGPAEVARQAGEKGFDVQLRRWMRPDGPVPELANLIKLARVLGESFALEDQIRLLRPDLSIISHPDLPPEPIRSRRLLITSLWHAVNDAAQGRPVTADLVRAVLRPDDGEKKQEYGRWRAREFDIPIINARDLVGELTGEPAAYEAPDRLLRFEHVYRELRTSRYAGFANVSVLRDLETLVTGDNLHEQVAELLRIPKCFTLVLWPAPESGRLWKERQADLVPQGRATEADQRSGHRSEVKDPNARRLLEEGSWES